MHIATGEMESEGADEPLEGIKRAKSDTIIIKVLVVLDGFYRRGPTIELSPGRSQQNVVLGRLLDVL